MEVVVMKMAAITVMVRVIIMLLIIIACVRCPLNPHAVMAGRTFQRFLDLKCAVLGSRACDY